MRVLYVATDLRDADILQQEVRRATPDLTFDMGVGLAALRTRQEQLANYDVLMMDGGIQETEQLQLIHFIRVRQLALPIIVLAPANGAGPSAALTAGADDFIVRGPKAAERLAPALRMSVERYRTLANALRENDKLKRSEARLRLIIEALPTGVLLLDQAGKVLAMNAAGVQYFGSVSPQDIVGRQFATMIPVEDQPGLREFLEKVGNGEEASLQFSSLQYDETPQVFNLRGLCIQRDQNGQNAVLGVMERVPVAPTAQHTWSADFDLGVGGLPSPALDMGSLPSPMLDVEPSPLDAMSELAPAMPSRAADLESRRQAAESRAAMLEAELAGVQTALAEAEVQQRAAAERLKQIETSAATVVAERDSLRHALIQAESQLADAQERSTQAASRVRELETAIEAEKRAADDHKRVAAENQRAADEHKKAADDHRRDAEEQKKLADANKRAADESKRVADDNKRLADEYKSTADERQRVADEYKRLAEERAQVGAQAGEERSVLAGTLEATRIELTAASAQLIVARQTADELRAAMASKDADLAQQLARLDDLQAELRRRDARLDEHRAEVTKRDARLQEHKAELALHAARMSEQQALLTERDGKIQSQAAQIAEQRMALDAHVTRLDEQAAALRERDAIIADKSNELAERAARLAEATGRAASLEDVRQALDRAREELSESRAELVTMSRTMATQREALEQLQATLTQKEGQTFDAERVAQARIAELEQELRSLSQRLRELMEQAARESSVSARGLTADPARRGSERLGRLAAAMAGDLHAAVGTASDAVKALVASVGVSGLSGQQGPSQSAHAGLSSRDAAERALDTLVRCGELARHLLRLSARYMGQSPYVDLAKVVRQQDALLRYLAGPDVELHLDLMPGLVSSDFDTQDLSHVLSSLIVAARDALPLGGAIRVSTTKQAVESHEPARGERPRPLMLSVTAKGYGIRPVPSTTCEEVTERCGGQLTTVIEPNVSWTLVAMLPGGVAEEIDMDAEATADLTRSA